MKLTGPYLTLGGGLAVAGVLLALSTTAVNDDKDKNSPPVAIGATVPAQDTGAAAPPTKVEDDAAEEEAPEVKPTPAGTYAGRTKGGNASVAIAVKGDTVIAYVCDGTKVEAWLQGSAKAGPLSLKGADGAKLTADYVGGKLDGTIRAAGKRFAFTVKAVKAPSGLYRAARNLRSAKVVGGWIVYDGEQVGMLDNGDGTESPAPPIDLKTGTAIIDGTPVKADVVDGSPVD